MTAPSRPLSAGERITRDPATGDWHVQAPDGTEHVVHSYGQAERLACPLSLKVQARCAAANLRGAAGGAWVFFTGAQG